jgi:hypothetical protein
MFAAGLALRGVAVPLAWQPRRRGDGRPPSLTPLELYLTAGRGASLAGRVLKIWSHPGSLPIFLAHHEQTGGSLLLPAHQRRVARIADGLRRLVPQIERRPLAMLFRLGSAAAPTIRSLRLSIDDVMLPAGERNGR